MAQIGTEILRASELIVRRFQERQQAQLAQISLQANIEQAQRNFALQEEGIKLRQQNLDLAQEREKREKEAETRLQQRLEFEKQKREEGLEQRQLDVEIKRQTLEDMRRKAKDAPTKAFLDREIQQLKKQKLEQEVGEGRIGGRAAALDPERQRILNRQAEIREQVNIDRDRSGIVSLADQRIEGVPFNSPAIGLAKNQPSRDALQKRRAFLTSEQRRFARQAEPDSFASRTEEEEIKVITHILSNLPDPTLQGVPSQEERTRAYMNRFGASRIEAQRDIGVIFQGGEIEPFSETALRGIFDEGDPEANTQATQSFLNFERNGDIPGMAGVLRDSIVLNPGTEQARFDQEKVRTLATAIFKRNAGILSEEQIKQRIAQILTQVDGQAAFNQRQEIEKRQRK